MNTVIIVFILQFSIQKLKQIHDTAKQRKNNREKKNECAQIKQS